MFNYGGTTYYKNEIIFTDNDFLNILPNQCISFSFSDRYLLGCDFFKWDKVPQNNLRAINHTKEVVSTLPTLKVRYRDENINIITDKIKNITIENILHVY